MPTSERVVPSPLANTQPHSWMDSGIEQDRAARWFAAPDRRRGRTTEPECGALPVATSRRCYEPDGALSVLSTRRPILLQKNRLFEEVNFSQFRSIDSHKAAFRFGRSPARLMCLATVTRFFVAGVPLVECAA